MNYRIELLIRKYQRSGVIGVGKSIFLLATRKVSPFELRADLRRRKIGRKLHQEFDGQVRYGLFKGLKLPVVLVWSKNDLASLLVGFYEQQVSEWISNRGIRFSQFIDIGSADGIYLAGILNANLADYALGFESSSIGRANSLKILELNKLESRSIILGSADRNFMEVACQYVESVSDRWSLLMCDIEGGELQLFDSTTAELLEKYFLVIELHEWTYSRGDLENIEATFSATHALEYLSTSARNPASVPELRALSDDERWNLCSEGRRHEMRWLVGIPHLYENRT
jgi:hypothetical protein